MVWWAMAGRFILRSSRNNKAGINAERRNMVEEGAGESEG